MPATDELYERVITEGDRRVRRRRAAAAGAVLVLFSAIVTAAFAHHHGGRHVAVARSTATSGSPATTFSSSASSTNGGLSARIVLPATEMAAGSTMAGQVVVENNTGSERHYVACHGPFQVMLVSGAVRPSPIWLMCAAQLTLPQGESTFPVTVAASYTTCGNGPPDSSMPACVNGNIPPLPAGDYEATLFQSSNLVPAPPTITVRVTS